MTHLTVEDLEEFASIKKLDGEAMAFIAKVNAHILHCDYCFRRLKAFQFTRDELKHRKNKATVGEHTVPARFRQNICALAAESAYTRDSQPQEE